MKWNRINHTCTHIQLCRWFTTAEHSLKLFFVLSIITEKFALQHLESRSIFQKVTKTQVFICKFHLKSRIHASRGIWQLFAYSFALLCFLWSLFTYFRKEMRSSLYSDRFCTLWFFKLKDVNSTLNVVTYLKILCLFSAHSHKSTINIFNIYLSADYWRKQVIKIGPKRASIRKGRRNLLFVRGRKATTVITPRKSSSYTME